MLKTPNRKHKNRGGKKRSSHSHRSQRSATPLRFLRNFVGKVQRVGLGNNERIEIV